MLKILYFGLLVAASAEDYKNHRVRNCWILAVWLLGLLQVIRQADRWVTLSLTCICFVLLLLLYLLVRRWNTQLQRKVSFGGADVRLIPGMMLAQGWDVALLGIFIGFSLAVVYYLLLVKQKKELPLVPWMTAGCLLAEVLLNLIL